jgi:TolB-like protein/class 3 adenylate cyclase/Flp pilus assembly protein TadD
MSAEVGKEIQLEIAHVLFIDIVGYSKLLITEQSELLRRLSDVVRETEQFRAADAEGKLVRLPTGDGMALVFRNTPEAPVQCALELSKRVKAHPELSVRMGIHSGPVNEVADVNERANITGAGINVAQRVMDCGEAGHILLSKHVADDLEQYPRWRPHLHDLGECEVKHGARVHVVNLYAEELGNPNVPEKFKRVDVGAAVSAAKKSPINRKHLLIAGVISAAFVIGFVMFRVVGTDRRAIRLNPAEERRRPGVASLPVPEKSIAVLPFENLSEEKANAFFADGVQDEILTDLAKIADLKVISRSSVMQYKSGVPRNLREIGQALGVGHLLEGSVQRAANRVRVNAQLIDARTDAHLWAQTYDRDLADVFAIQSEIAKAIADQLQAKLSPSERSAIEQAPTANVAAFDLYSRAKTLILSISFGAASRQKMLEAVDLLNQAIARDPSFFQAYCLLARAYIEVYFLIDHTAERLASAETALNAAFRLRADAGEAHLARAENLYYGYLDYDGALAELDIARRTLPNYPRVFELTGYILRRRGKHEEGLRNLERALELDPRNLDFMQQIAISYALLRRYSEEADILNRGLAIKPDDVETKVARAFVELDWKADTRLLHQALASISAKEPAAMQNIADGWFNCALAERDTAAAANALVALGENNFGMDNSQFTGFRRSFGEGLIARIVKDEAKAHAAFAAARAEQEKRVQAQPNYGPALSVLGVIDARLGRKEEALSEGRRAIELLPVTKDSINGTAMIEYLAVIAAWVGEKDLACQQLAIATRLPGSLSYGQLKLLPYWDPLRGDPRFEKIVASLAPKDANK